jgi:hypothetical protein
MTLSSPFLGTSCIECRQSRVSKIQGKAAEAALMKEVAQLKELGVHESVAPATLTSEQREGALRPINLIKEKRDG